MARLPSQLGGVQVRHPPVRAEPVTLEDHLARAYAARFSMEGCESEDYEAVTLRLSQAGFTRTRIETERDRLAQIEDRCVVSRTQRQALDSALGKMPG